MTELKDSIEQLIGELPSMPAILAKVLNLLNNEGVPNMMLADAVAHDPALAARILKLANSAASSVRNRVKNLDHAIGIVGRKAVRDFATEGSVRVVCSSLKDTGALFWENSVGCAIACRVIAKSLRTVNMDEAFLAGLFLPLGKVVLALKKGTDYLQVLKSFAAGPRNLNDLERDRFGISHELVTAALLDKWQMAPTLISGIQHCYSLKNEAYDPQAFILSRIVNIANSFTEKTGIGHFSPRESVPLDRIFAAHLLRMPPEQVVELFDEFQAAYRDDREYYLG